MATITNPDGTPANLSPEEAAQVLQAAQAPTTDLSQALSETSTEAPAGAPTIINPYRPAQVESEDGQPVTPQQAAEIRKQAGIVDPMLDMTPEDMVALAKQTKDASPEQRFNILQAFQARQAELSQDPTAVQRAATAWDLYKKSTNLGDLPSAEEIAENGWQWITGLTKQAFALGTGLPVLEATARIAPGKSEKIDTLFNSALRKIVEAGSGTRAAFQGSANLVERLFTNAPHPEDLPGAIAKVAEHIPGFGGIAQTLKTVEPTRPDKTPQEQIDTLFLDAAKADQASEMLKGKGAFIDPKVAESLQQAGFPVRPEEVQSMATGDILNTLMFGKVFGGLTKGIAKAAPPIPPLSTALGMAPETLAVLPKEVFAAPDIAGTISRGTAKVTGAVIAEGARPINWILPKVATALPLGGAAKGFLEGGPAGMLVGYAAGKEAARGIKSALPKLAYLENIGRQVAGKEPLVSPYAQLAKDTLEALPGAAADVGKGAALDIGIAATAETPEEVKGVGLGSMFGLLGGAGRVGGWVLSGQLIAPRGAKPGPTIPSNHFYPTLDSLHTKAIAGATPGEINRVNGLRALVRGAIPNADFLWAGKQPPAGTPDPLIPALLGIKDAQGKSVVTPEQAQFWANQKGLISRDVAGHHLILARDVDAAPHEVTHALEAALGESTMRQIDQMIQADPKYSGKNWNAIAQDYASRLGWDPSSGKPWQDTLLEQTKFGLQEAQEKILRQTVGEGPFTPEQADTAWTSFQKDNPGATWRNVLTPEEQSAIANRLISREIFAENGDAAFKHGVAPDPAIAAKIARVVGSFVRYLGGDPLAGRVSEVSRYPLSYDISQRVGAETRARLAGKPVVEPVRPPGAPRPALGIPTTPEQKEQAGTESTEIANTAPDTIPVGGIRSQKEILGTIAEAVAANEPTALEYRATPGVPAAGAEMKGANLERVDRDIRRSEIQLARLPDAVRSLWERLFTPTKVLKTKGGMFLVQGYNPQVFAANADTMAGALADLIAKRPDFANLSPFPIDPATKSFTPEGWKQLHAYLYQNVIPNYLAGRTASGVPIKMPEEVIQQGFYKPGLAPGRPMDQRTSEFISMLFGVPLPKSLRSVAEKMPLNIMGQRVRVATLGTEAVEPLVPRKPATEAQKALWGPEAAVLETNPTRSEIEHALQENGIPIPSLMETIQHLRAENIVDAERLPGEPRFEGSTVGAAAGFQPQEAQFQVNKPAEDISDFRPEAIEGASVHLPRTSYPEAAAGTDNPWVRRSADPSHSTETDNSNRTLLVQISNDLINPESLAGAAKDEATRYYDMLYSGARPGYARLQDFWEIPQWIGDASHFLPDADVYVIRNIDQAKQFLETANYRNVVFSALDTNKGIIREVVQDYPGKVDIGGYVDPKTFEDLPNVKWHDSMESLAKDMGVPYAEGVDYRHFQGSDVIPRLTMSKGCHHKCAFCSVPKTVEETSADVVRQQADAIANLGSKLVYLNDKTFGQASNYKQLAEINQQILAKNSDFKGFIIQTTAAQLKEMPADWLKTSGIKFVELGVESYNDPILKAMHKPASTKLINEVTDKLRQNGIALIPNIILGYPNETAETYANTIKFLKDNKDIISHANIYNLALYKDAELGKQVLSVSDNDFNENVLEKSFHTNPEIHRQFAGDVYGIAQSMLEGKPSAAQFAPAATAQEFLRDKLKAKDSTIRFINAAPAGYWKNLAEQTWAHQTQDPTLTEHFNAHEITKDRLLKVAESLDNKDFHNPLPPGVNAMAAPMDKLIAESAWNTLLNYHFLGQEPARGAIRQGRIAKGFDDLESQMHEWQDLLSKGKMTDGQYLSLFTDAFKKAILQTRPESVESWLGPVERMGLHKLDLPPSAQFAPRKRELPPLGISMLRMPDGRLVESDPGQLHYQAMQKARNLGYSEEDIAAAEYGRKNLKSGKFVSTKDLKAQWEGDLPSQMQSPANVGRIEDLPDTREKLFPAGPVYYSQLARTIEQKFSGEQMPADQLSAILRSPQSGVKADELKWSGLDDFLKGKGRVSKSDVQEFLKQNAVQVKEVTKGGGAEPRPSWQDVSGNEERWELSDPESGDRYAVIDYEPEKNEDYPWALYRSDNGRRVGLYESLEPAQDAGLDYVPKNPVSREGTKFESYQLPGGENYREILFTLPPKSGDELFQTFLEKRGLSTKQFEGLTDKEKAPLMKEWSRKAGQTRGTIFTSGHWDESNVLAHTRVNDRTDSIGKPGLFIEEIQSDWHQKGRKEGYQTQETELPKGWKVVKTESPSPSFQIVDEEDFIRASGYTTEAEALEDLPNVLRQGSLKVPDAPFKNTWHELVFRRMVRQAADEGKDWVGWTTGEQQAERYNLSKHIDSITVHKIEVPKEKAGWHVSAEKAGNQVIDRKAETDADLAGLIGKELAEKAVKKIGDQIADPYYDGDSYETSFSGLDLKVGGEGMKGFYDKILVDYANKFGKKFGAGVEDRKVPQTSHGQTYELRESGAGSFTIFEKTSSGDVEYDTFRSRDVAERELRRLESMTPTSVHSLPITPEMRESVTREGVAQFQAATPAGKELERRGYKVFRDDYGPSTGIDLAQHSHREWTSGWQHRNHPDFSDRSPGEHGED